MDLHMRKSTLKQGLQNYFVKYVRDGGNWEGGLVYAQRLQRKWNLVQVRRSTTAHLPRS